MLLYHGTNLSKFKKIIRTGLYKGSYVTPNQSLANDYASQRADLYYKKDPHTGYIFAAIVIFNIPKEIIRTLFAKFENANTYVAKKTIPRKYIVDCVVFKFTYGKEGWKRIKGGSRLIITPVKCSIR